MHVHALWRHSFVGDLPFIGLLLAACAGLAALDGASIPLLVRDFTFSRRLSWAALLLGLTVIGAPTLAQAQAGAGCGGTAITNIAGLDNLLATIWAYLMGGTVTKVIAAALFIFGLFGLFERRAGPIVFGFVGAFIAAFAPTIIKAVFSAAASGAASLC